MNKNDAIKLKYTVILLILILFFTFESNILTINMYGNIQSFGWPSAEVSQNRLEISGAILVNTADVRQCKLTWEGNVLLVKLFGYPLPIGHNEGEYLFIEKMDTSQIQKIYLVGEGSEESHLIWERTSD